MINTPTTELTKDEFIDQEIAKQSQSCPWDETKLFISTTRYGPEKQRYGSSRWWKVSELRNRDFNFGYTMTRPQKPYIFLLDSCCVPPEYLRWRQRKKDQTNDCTSTSS